MVVMVVPFCVHDGSLTDPAQNRQDAPAKMGQIDQVSSIPATRFYWTKAKFGRC
jgi:hypothetical protein